MFLKREILIQFAFHYSFYYNQQFYENTFQEKQQKTNTNKDVLKK